MLVATKLQVELDLTQAGERLCYVVTLSETLYEAKVAMARRRNLRQRARVIAVR